MNRTHSAVWSSAISPWSARRPWLCGIARNLGLRARRRRRREVSIADADAATDPASAAEGSPLTAVEDAEVRRIVRDTLSRIPATCREVLVLYYHSGRSIEQVAAALGISQDAALQRLSRGRRRLAREVSRLVEHSLEQSRPRRSLKAGVLLALPRLAKPVHSPVARHINPAHGGWTMLKIALVATGLAAGVTTTTYVVHQARSSAALPPAAAPVASHRPATGPAHSHAPAPAARPVALSRFADRTPPALPSASPAAGAPPPCDRPAGSGEHCDRPAPASPPPLSADAMTRLGLDRGPSRGPADAPVQIVLFIDFACHYCGQVLGTIDELWDEYPHKIHLVIKQFPVHASAQLAAEAALAADAQGKFWPLHDLMIAHQSDGDSALSRAALLDYADQARLDVAAFRRALDQHAYRRQVEADMAAAKAAGVQGTPSFLINGTLVRGAQPVGQLRATIDGALKSRSR